MATRRCEDESIDELAAYIGAGEAVAALTKRCSLELSAIHTPGQCQCSGVSLMTCCMPRAALSGRLACIDASTLSLVEDLNF